MKKVCAILSAIILLTGCAFAQKESGTSAGYTNAIGVKFYPGALTFKHFVDDKNAVEGLVYFYNKGTRVTALYEIHNELPDIEGLKWYVGPGAHLGFVNSNNGGGVFLGLDGVLGLDYKVPEAPIDVSVDLQPAFEFAKYFNNRVTIWGGVGIRYTF